ncbi:EAL domain-containing protein [Burkholderia humptydooensis]|uniref:EAL domain-containing protein n=1 Tax=Burkholderia humptydooensis TaxID=430531 RepID=A0A7U4P690_9BURK|nr:MULTISPECIES: EAL domain-containing protein [Burkholderia]AJY42185.1 diguanylate cyclase domain protein [Burkholderia sp. 2002721687]ALX43755.1 diguanylate phosphodiesterase [Burkholderia humptydooensis]QPS44310.1 EAL domain-containing protein [Burkholderia humptydooensis]
MASVPSRLSCGPSALAAALLGAALLSAGLHGIARSRAPVAIPTSIGARLTGCAFIAEGVGEASAEAARGDAPPDFDAIERVFGPIGMRERRAHDATCTADASVADAPHAAQNTTPRLSEAGAAAVPQSQSYLDMIDSTFREPAAIVLALSLLGMIALALLPVFRIRRLALRLGEAEGALAMSEARARAALVAVGDGVIFTGRAGRVECLNPAAERLIGMLADDCRGRPLVSALRLSRTCGDAVGSAGSSGASDSFYSFDASGSAASADAPLGGLEDGGSCDATLYRADGGAIAVRATASSIAPPSGRAPRACGSGRVLVLKSLATEHDLVRRLAWQTTHDPLTGLPNRAEFERHVAFARAANVRRPVALLFVDLDCFRIVNDTCGYAAGDAMLAALAARLVSCAASADVVARLGGDEFCVLLDAGDEASAVCAAEHLRASVDGFVFVWDGQPFSVTASVGVALLGAPDRAPRVEDAVRLAGIACDVAKARGRNRVQLADPHDRALAHHISDVSWCARVRQALEYDDFCLYVQPIIDTATQGATGLPRANRGELLLRMGSLGEREGVAPPGLFIRAAERYGLVTDIDRWVVRTVLDALARTRSRRFSEYAINLSGISIGDERFLDYVLEQFARTRVAPALICFEITETAAIANLAGALRFMHELRALGCRFALDDFGSGMASLSYLRQLPVEYLKIDGSFVTGIANDAARLDIVASINDIGHAMNCKTIAEYVDSAATLRKLAALGVDYAQGYYIGRPVPWREAPRLQARAVIVRWL